MRLAPAAIGIVLCQDSAEVLLVKRRDTPIWVLPGGGIDPLEEPESAVIREVYEETGYQISIERQAGEYDPINKLGSKTFVYLCKIEKGKASLSLETSAIAFFPLRELPKNFFFLHAKWLSDALKSNEVVKKKITELTYWKVFKYFLLHPLITLRYLKTRLFYH